MLTHSPVPRGGATVGLYPMGLPTSGTPPTSRPAWPGRGFRIHCKTPGPDPSMSDTAPDLRDLLNRVRRGEAGSRRAPLDPASARRRRLAAHVSGSYPGVAARHDLDSVVHETWLRLAKALETTEPASVEHFFRLAAQKVRHVLLDMIAHQRR